MRKLITSIAVLALLGCGVANGQNILRNLGERARHAVEQNIGNKVEKGVNDALDGKLGGKDKDSKDSKDSKATKGATAEAAGWKCADCGHAGNPGKFCEECGAKKPEPKPQAAAAEGWKCADCGHAGNPGKFCEECGAKKPEGGAAVAAEAKPEPKPAPEQKVYPEIVWDETPTSAIEKWDCPKCGREANNGKICGSCGAVMPKTKK